jgi:hypothetical protein
MRRAVFSPIRFAPLLSVLIVPACFSLPKVGVVRVIDNFTDDASLEPTWDAFDSWTCGAHADADRAGGGGQDGGGGGGGGIGDVDAGSAVACSLNIGPSGQDPSQSPPPVFGTVAYSLLASFTLTTPDELAVATATKLGSSDGGGTAPMPVSLTAFSRLSFDAKLVSTTASFPTGTHLSVEFRCSSSNPNDPLVASDVGLNPGVVTWKSIVVPFSEFTTSSKRQTCLATVDSIGFVVVPGSPTGAQVAGTLSLDDIVLE